MSGPKRNPDKLNTIGVVVVGICGAVLVYVTIIALQAFYVDDTSEIQTMADYGGQDTFAKQIRTTQEGSINETVPNGAVADPTKQTYRIPVEDAMKKVVEEAKKDPGSVSNLVPMVGKSDTPSVFPIFGRPKPLPTAGSGSAAPAPPPAAGGSSAPQAPTGGIGASGNPPPGNEGAATKPGAGTGSAAAPAPQPKPPVAKPPIRPKPPAKPPGAGTTKRFGGLSAPPAPPAKGNAP